MSEEGKDEMIVPESEIYEYPDIYFVRIREEEEQGSEYNVLQGAIYDYLRHDVRVDAKDALQASQYLNQGEIDEAEEYVNRVLSDE